MKQQRNDQRAALRVNILAASIALAFGSGVAWATDLADVPLVNATTLAVPPNLALVIDDSGSMDEENMPDSNNTNNTKYCYRWHKYNTLTYNPANTYKAPIKADKTRFPDAPFTAALKDGYFALNGKMYDGSTDNTPTNLNTEFVKVKATVTYPDFGTSAHRATSVKVTLLNGTTVELLGSSPVPASGSTNEDTVGQAISNSINANSAVTGFTAVYDGSNNSPIMGRIHIYAPASQGGLTTSPVVTLEKTSGTTQKYMSAGAFSTSGYFYATHKTNPNSTTCEADANYNLITSSANIAAPDTTNGSAAALTNFANWYSYYRKRAFLMKAGVGEAFATLEDGKFRVGYFTIDSLDSEVELADGQPVNNDLAHADFTGTSPTSNRGLWYARLYGTRQALYTPLRGALSRIGRIYSGTVAGWDPIQYSCQRNYTLLTTDGYWNTNAEDGDYGPFREDNSTLVGDQDGVAGVTRPEFDANKKASTLADVAYYYYHNDLRTSAKSNCTGAPRADLSTGDVCFNDVPGLDAYDAEKDYAAHQHMTTYTLGLGVSGTLAFDEDYPTQAAGAYVDLKSGAKNWPDPINNTGGQRIDDLWHAAVNGRGLYLSAGNPEELAKSLAKALNKMKAATGAGGGAAAADLAPVSGSTEMYVASYQTDEWYGDVKAYTANADARTVSGAPNWETGALLDARVAAASDTRTIYVDVAGTRNSFTWANLNAQQRAYFDNTKLSQYTEWNSTKKAAATGEALVNYLRGQTGNAGTLYRERSHVLGDIVHAAPMYVKKSLNTFVPDPTYGGRMGILYVAANDGMLHAICTEASGACAAKGQELWAFVIPPVMKNMWYLADNLQQGYHHFFVDGPLSVADIEIGGQWRTILIGGLGKGGRSFYAFDVTDPADPELLWTHGAEGIDDIVNTPDDNVDVGYSYGLALTTKVDDKDWRVLLTSGYNNVPNDPKAGDFPGADGNGHVFLVDPDTGGLVTDIGAGLNELAQVANHVPNFTTKNSATKTYGGDLGGDMYRIDLVAGNSTKVVGTGKPITTGPTISSVEGYTVLYFGTGRYLGQTDLTGSSQNYIVAVRADKSNLGLTDLINQTAQDQTIHWSSDNGWYFGLSAGEQVHVDPVMFEGMLLVFTIVPQGSECKPGGYSYFHVFDYRSGEVIYSEQLADAAVGFSVIDLEIGGGAKDPRIAYTTADGKIKFIQNKVELPKGGGGIPEGTRIMWRELIDKP